MISLISVAIVILCGGYCFFWRNRRAGTTPVPGPKPWPLVGNALQIDKKKLHVALYEWAQVHGEIFQIDMLGSKYLMLNSPDLYESVLRKFTNRPYSIAGTATYNGSGVDFTNRDFLIEENRRVAHDIAEDKVMHELFKGEVKTLIDELKDSSGNDVVVNKSLKRTAAAYMLILVLGCMPEEKNYEGFWKFLEIYRNFFGGAASIVLNSMPWLRFVPGPFKRQFDDCKIVMEEMVEGFLDIIRQGKGNGRGMIEKLMIRKRDIENDVNEKEKLIDGNIYGFVTDALIGSIVPMSFNMIGLIMCILKHQSVQDKLHAELDRVCPSKPPNPTDRDQLHYLNATFLEGLRYMSMVSLTIPHTNTEDTEINGYFVEKGTQIFGNMFTVHHADSVWGDSWEFRPERFLDAFGHLLPSEHALRKSVKPFGTGLRMCKGYNIAEPAMFMYISNILYYFNILPPADGVLPECDPKTFDFAAALTPPDFCCRFDLRLKE